MMIRQGARIVIVSCVLSILQAASAEVGPPVEIKFAPNPPQAESGHEYASAFKVRVYRAGTLSEFKVDGEGWAVLAVEPPADPLDAGAGLISVAFRAIPRDPNQPVGLSFNYNGRPVRQQYNLGTDYFARAGKARSLVQIASSTALPDPRHTTELQSKDTTRTSRRGGTVRVRGRIVYERSGRDVNDDGDMDDPEDIRPFTVGADEIDVRLWDSDPVSHDEMWSGLTDEEGYFDTGDVSADVDGDGSGPDLVIYVETQRDGWVDVTDNSIEEWTYYWESPEITDFEESFYDFGVLTPLEPAERPAIHIYNSMIRARRFILEKPGIGTPFIQVEWPDDSRGNNAWYEDSSNEIHLSSFHTWREDTHTHEYGHHYIDSAYENDTPDPVYCNDYCDEDDNQGGCSNPFSEGCGHCQWCEETENDAWSEGWPNWLADVVTRDYLLRYQHDDGSPFQALFTRSQENIQMCCQNGVLHDATKTEGFVGALLRDMEDAGQDDHDGDGILDLLCLGPDPIFQVVSSYEPQTVTEFIDAFLTEFPEHTNRLWPTAFNVGGSPYVAGIPADTEPPGIVPSCDSPTHPIGTGGSLPCMQFEWDPAPDDVSGASAYSYILTSVPQEPDEVADPVTGGDNCKLTTTIGQWQLGQHFFNIKAQGGAGNWSDNWWAFGPFQIVDCNGTGLLDVCDISCSANTVPGMCSIGTSPCGVAGCGNSFDCQPNNIPDECDIADGTSEDCNEDGVPDDCQSIKHWVNDPGLFMAWSDSFNWIEDQIPQDGDHVCISIAGNPTVSFHEDSTVLASLASHDHFEMSGGTLPWPDLELDGPSFIDSDLILEGFSTLIVNDTLAVNGELSWFDGTINGPGATDVSGGMTLGFAAVDLNAHHLTISGGAATAGDRLMNLRGGAVLTIGEGVTYTYSGDFRVFDGGTTTTVDIDGTLLRDSGSGDVQVYSFVDNSGLIHNQVGELILAYGGKHDGDILGDPGTQMTLGNSHDLLPTSSLTGDAVKFLGGTSFVRGGVNIADTLTVDGGTWTFTNEADVTSYGPDLFVVGNGKVHFEIPQDTGQTQFETVTLGQGNYGGVPYFDTGQPVSIDALNLVRGTINGADPITINDSFTWSNGSFFTGGDVTCNSPMTVQYTSSARYLYRTFNNTDYATFLGSIGPSGSGVFQNLATGTVELQGDNTGLTSGSVTNAGLIVKTDVGSGNVGSYITNSGVIHAQSGEIVLGYSGSLWGGENSGEILGDPGTLLRFVGNHEMLPGSSLAGDDVSFIGQGTSHIRGDVNITGTLSVNGATTTFTDEANVTSYGHTLLNPAGSIHFDAAIPGRSLSFDTVTVGEGNYGGQPHFDTGQPVSINTLHFVHGSIWGDDPITINDSFTWTNGSFFTGGDVTCNAPSTFYYSTSSRPLYRTFNNNDYATFLGAIRPAGGGRFINLPGGTIDIADDVRCFGGGTVENAGRIVKSVGTGTSELSSTELINTGKVEIQTGILEISNADYIQTAGQTVLNGGALKMFLGALPVQIQGGALVGIGSIVGDLRNSGGVVSPGFSTGTIHVDEDYTQGENGTLDIEIAGRNPGDFDVLMVNGTANLDGELRVTDIDGFVAMAGDAFIILTGAQVNGTFVSQSNPAHYEVVYSATDVSVHWFPPSPDLNADGAIDLKDVHLFQGCFHGPGEPPSSNCPEGVRADLDEDNDVDLNDYRLLFLAAWK